MSKRVACLVLLLATALAQAVVTPAGHARVQGRSAGTAWKWLPARLGGTTWQAGGLVNGHR